MRVAIGEDRALLREGLARLLTDSGFEVITLAADAPSLIEAALEQSPDLVVTDVRMPPHNADDGLLAALQIRAARPQAAILVLSQHVQPRYALELLDHGASGVGYLLKQRIADVESFIADLRRVAAGGSALDAEVVAAMLNSRRIASLTPRQREVLALMAEGRSNAAIGRALVITEKAVVNHVTRIYDQLGLPPSPDDHRRVIAVVRYLVQRPPLPS
jgi:DNA-binding NarL/FixJ family response regulator